MSICIHCATPFSVSNGLEKFCCRGCEYVYDLIHDEGFERFYDLREKENGSPVRSVPFESHDFAWVGELMETKESTVEEGRAVEADFSLEGLSCMGCVWLVEKLFHRHAGALDASAHPATGLLRLSWEAGKCDLTAFAQDAASFGYRLSPREAGAGNGEAAQLAAKLGLCGAFALNAMIFTLPRYVGMPEDFVFGGVFQLVSFLSAALAMLTGGTYFISRAWMAARAGTPHIDLPIALGIVSAFAGSVVGWALGVEGLIYFDFVATFIFLMLGGRYLQLAAVEKNRNRLQRRRPLPDFMKSPDRKEAVPLGEIRPGMRLEVDPGQTVPVSGVLESDAADFSLEWINGEADPVAFRAGRNLPAGAIHLGGRAVIFTASETWEDSLLAGLTSSERPVARVPALEKLLAIYLVAIILIGLVAFLMWLPRAGPAAALQVMISVFVVSCPCALGIALPLADEMAGAAMERVGVFIRDPLLWARLRRVRTVFFDKTGTLTLERPLLINPEAVAELDHAGRLALAQLTSGSLHPVSRSLLEAIGGEGQRLLRGAGLPDITDVPGMGRFFEAEEGRWSLGRPGWMTGAGKPKSVHDAELCCGNEIIAHFRFQESLRPDAVSALEYLRRDGFRLVIVSGDRREKVAAAAELLGIRGGDAHYGRMPEEKEKIVRETDRSDSLYLGDGANDSLAFNAAWTTGTPVVDRSLLEVKSDFYFLGQSLRFLPRMMSLSHRRWLTVRVAFGFALVYNLIAISAAVAGLMNPLVAAIIMPASSAITLGIVALGLKGSRKVPSS